MEMTAVWLAPLIISLFILAGLAIFLTRAAPDGRPFTRRERHLLALARDAALDHLADLAVTVNVELRVVDIRPIGRLDQDDPVWNRLAQLYCREGAVQGEEELAGDAYRLKAVPLRYRAGVLAGWLLILHAVPRTGQPGVDRMEPQAAPDPLLVPCTPALLENQPPWEAIFNHVAVGIFHLDLLGQFTQFNDAWAGMLCYTRDELSLLSSRDVMFGKETLLNAEWFKLRTGGRPVPYRCEERFVCQDGRPFWGELSVTPVLNASERLESLVCVVFDISDRKRYEQQILHNAMHDSLTGLPNRELFLDRLGQALHRSKLYEANECAVLYLDYDHFKDINDSLGHNFGDHLLIQSAARLKKLFLPTDTFARMGGDEFVILLDESKERGRAVQMSERILEQMSQPFLLDGRHVVISASIGILKDLSGYQKAEDVLRDADIAMYRAKMRGRNRCEVFDAEMRARAVARLELEIGLRSAISNGELFLDYQPVMSFQSGQITGFEALVRWQSPQHGLIFPGEFISLAEETGMIYPVGQWVLEEACRTMAAWQKKFPADPALSIGVNLSPRQFNSMSLLEQVAKALQESGLEPRSLRVEITESVLLEDLEATERLLLGLREMGVQTLIDDFGTGYSSLSYLYRFPISALKIDRAFIARLEDGEQAQSGVEIVRAILAMAREMGIKVVAEGIETRQQMDILRELSCDFGQGFLISRPLPKENVEPYLLRQPMSTLDRIAMVLARREAFSQSRTDSEGNGLPV